MPAGSTTDFPGAADDAATVRAALKVVGFRPDGLGIRLECLLEAMHLAELLDADFAVVWPDPVEGLEHHAVTPAAQTFTQAFCDAHVVSRSVLGDYADVAQPVADLSALAALAGASRGWLVRRAHALNLLPENMRRPPRGGFRRLFEAIPFRPHLAAAIAAAAEAPLPDAPAAVHLRAGDIIYGKHRFGARFTRKVISLPVARHLIEMLREQGGSVLLFSQDRAAADLFRQTPGVVIAADLAPQGDAVAQALFEIALMSRCRQVYAGNSVFAQIAALIGDGEMIDPRTVFKRSEQAKVIERDLFESGCETIYPPLHTAFAAWSGAEMLVRKAPGRAARLLSKALDHDPENACYALRLASVLCTLDRVQEAEALVEGALTDADGRLMRTRALAMLQKAGKAGSGSVLVADRAILTETVPLSTGPIAQLMAELEALEA